MDTTAWLSEQLEAHAPERESDPQAAHRLAEAYAALAGAPAQAFGLAVPPELDARDALRARALELLKAWLGKLEPEAKDKVRAQLSGYGIGPPPPPVVTSSPDAPPDASPDDDGPAAA
jgi:hypothetical protein